MSVQRHSLRSRLLVAMAGIAVGVLVVTGVTTVTLARRGTQRAAIHHLEGQAPLVAQQLRGLARTIRGREFRGRRTAPIARLVTSVLRVTNATVVTVGPDGSVTAGASSLVGATDPRAARPGAPAVGAPDEVADGVTFDDLDAQALLGGERQTGSVRGRAFVAQPIMKTADGTAVLIVTEAVDPGVVSRARGFFLIGGALALATAGVVSFFLARRLTRPLAAMGITASAIAGGDLTARVDLGPRTDQELADLGRTLNEMALQLEDARHAERAFLLSVSHDLRTPLTSIRGFAEALTDGTIPATVEQQRAGTVIAAEANRLERLVADLLDLARLDAHQFSLTPRRFDAAATVRTAVEAFGRAAAELGIRLQVDGPDEIESTGDPERVAQIVANLVENALKYSRERIDVSVATADARTLELVVRDDGPGIDPADRHRVFERLFVSRAVPGRSVGTGLGLAIVGELTSAMGGSATVDGTSESGAVFRVQLPITGAV